MFGSIYRRVSSLRLRNKDAVWVGYRQNIPRKAQNEDELLGIRWRLLD